MSKSSDEDQLNIIEIFLVLWNEKQLIAVVTSFCIIVALIFSYYSDVPESDYLVSVPYSVNLYSHRTKTFCIDKTVCIEKRISNELLRNIAGGWDSIRASHLCSNKSYEWCLFYIPKSHKQLITTQTD